MAKRITITMRDYVYDKHLNTYNGNVSAFIEEMFIRGIEAETSNLLDMKTKYLELNREHKRTTEELNKIKKQLGRYKKLHNDRTPEEAEKEQREEAMIEALRRNNPMRLKGL